MSEKITNDVLESHLNCKYKGHLNVRQAVGLNHAYLEILSWSNAVALRRWGP